MNDCEPTVTWNELYVMLQKFTQRGRIRNMATAYDAGLGGPVLRRTARYRCTRLSVVRTWRNNVNGFSLLEGVWYAGSQVRDLNIYCS